MLSLADILVVVGTGAVLTMVRIAWEELRELEDREYRQNKTIELQRDRIKKLKQDIREARDELNFLHQQNL